MVAGNKRHLSDINHLQVRKSLKGFLSHRKYLVDKQRLEDVKS